MAQQTTLPALLPAGASLRAFLEGAGDRAHLEAAASRLRTSTLTIMEFEMTGRDDGPEVADQAPAKKPVWQRLLPIAIIAVGLVSFFATGANDYLSLGALRENQAALDDWIGQRFAVALLLFVLAYAALTAMSFPGASFLTIAGGFLFGLWAGTFGVVIGATAGAVALYYAARTVFGDALKSKAGGFVSRIERGFEEDGLSYMFLLRLLPIFPFWGVNIACGLIGVPIRNYALGTFFGIIPGSFVYVSIGNGIAAGVADSDDLSLLGVLAKPEIILPLVGLVVLALVPIAYKKLRGGKKAAS